MATINKAGLPYPPNSLLGIFHRQTREMNVWLYYSFVLSSVEDGSLDAVNNVIVSFKIKCLFSRRMLSMKVKGYKTMEKLKKECKDCVRNDVWTAKMTADRGGCKRKKCSAHLKTK